MKIEIESHPLPGASPDGDDETEISVDGVLLVTVHGAEHEHRILARRIVAVLMTPCPLTGDAVLR